MDVYMTFAHIGGFLSFLLFMCLGIIVFWELIIKGREKSKKK